MSAMHNFGSNVGSNVPLFTFFNGVEPDEEPFPTFDIEINKEDKDKDIDHPSVRKDPKTDKPREEDSRPDQG